MGGSRTLWLVLGSLVASSCFPRLLDHSTTDELLLQSVRNRSAVPLIVVLIAWNRPASLGRLLRSLERAEYGEGPSPMELRFALDASSNTTVDQEIDALIEGVQWPHGAVRVRRRLKHAGLRKNVLGAWTPDDERGSSSHGRPAVFLEDDIEVSPLWWLWAQSALRAYAPPRYK